MTIKEIADLAGVSIGTVDRVIHGRGRVSRATKEKIEAIVSRHGYTPNPIARRLKRSRDYRFVALLPRREEDSGYWLQARGGIERAAEEIEALGAKTEIAEFDRYDQSSFRAAASSLDREEIDGVLLAPVMPDEARRFVSSLDAIPYAFFDADLPDTAPVCRIGQDPFRGGYLAGRLAGLFARGEGPFAIVEFHSEDYHIRLRRSGFSAFAEEAGFAVIEAPRVDLENAGAAEWLISELRRAAPDVKGVFVTSASSHRIAEAAGPLRAAGRFIIIGYDLVPENEARLRAGDIDAIISQRPETQGYRGLLDLHRSVALGASVPPRVEIPIDLFLKENLPRAVDSAKTQPDRESEGA